MRGFVRAGSLFCVMTKDAESNVVARSLGGSNQDPDAAWRHDAAISLIESLLPRLRRALIASFGRELGDDAAAEAVTWALAHAERVSSFANPAGYLYRVGQSWAIRQRKARPQVGSSDRYDDHVPDIDLHRALQQLTEVQRICVVLIHGNGWRYEEVAQVLHRSEASVRNHLHRGLAQLRDLVPPRDTPLPDPTLAPSNPSTNKAEVI
jgi:RNA polymerase sigma factor (sigma-70 family)